ncbi:MAG: LamG-like jellyroll fold domain-containing protein, partial [Planctomycetota bacterium]
MCKRLFLFVLVLGVVCPVRGATIFHWRFDGPEGQEIISDVDIVGGKVATKFYDEGYDPNEQDFSLTYGEANPWWGVTGTSADYVREPGDNDPGVGFFVPDDAAVDLSGLSECTIEAFVYPREVIQSVIVRKYQGTGVYYIDTRPENNSYHTDKGVFAIRMASSSYDTGDHNSLCHDVPYTAEEWHHVALVWTGTVMKFYMNGVQSDDIGTRVGDGFVQGTGVSEVPFEGPIGNSATALGIGCIVRGAMTDPCAPPSTGQFFNGRIDELIFSDVALSPEQLRINWPEPHASQPNPKNGTEEACPGDELCWKSGAYADQHDVYLGTDRNEVESATTASSSVYVGRQSANCVTPSLDLGETYYWRIDEVNDACSPFLWKGAVWEFSTNDGTAYNPDPSDEQTVIPLEPVLSWSPGCEATSHKVYFSTDFDAVDQRQAGAYLNEVGPNTIDPCDGELEYFTWYYWAVDETDGVSTWPGAVWSFRTQSAIIDVNMVAHYTLDEKSGAIASDSSGYENHADVDGGPDEGPDWDANDGQWGGSLGFDDDTDIECPTGLMSKISEGITVAVWLKDADRPGSDNWVFEVPGSSGSVVQAAVVEDGNDEVYWRAGNETNDVITWNLDGKSAGSVQGWHFWAFVKNEVTGEISIYFDGFVVESNDVVDNTVINVRNKQMRFGVGSGHSNDFIGRMDDIKVFDIGLSATQVASLFRGGDLGVAWAPDPGDNETEVPRDVNLAWQPGDWVEKHDVYLGTDWDDVNDATTSSVPTYRGRQDPCEYDPPTDLAMDTTYYWRIDEVNTADPNLWKGSVWTFTVANFVIIDDFEDYDDINRVYFTWEDGQVNGTGSYIDLGIEPFSPAHTGDQSMLYTYDNTLTWFTGRYWS